MENINPLFMVYLINFLVAAWVYSDSKKRGKAFINSVVYFFLTYTIPLFGLLMYIVIRGSEENIKSIKK